MADPTAPPEFQEHPVPLWQKIVAVGYVLVTAVVLVAFRSRLHADFWPLDASRIAPNVLATLVQLALATPAAVLLWPPTRRRIHGFVTRHTAPIHARLEAAHAQRERIHEATLAAHTETQRHLKHVIEFHPDLPPLPPKPANRDVP